MLDDAVPVIPALTVWEGKALDDALALAIRVLPQPPWDGFFLAALEKPA